jgi:hypothetical protein
MSLTQTFLGSESIPSGTCSFKEHIGVSFEFIGIYCDL